MPKLKNIKFYTHNFLHVGLKMQKAKKESPVVNFFYITGVFVISAVKKMFAFFAAAFLYIAKDAKKTRQTLNQRLKILKEKKFAKTLALFLILSLAVFGGLKILEQASKALEIKDQIMSQSLLGARFLNLAKNSIEQKNYGQANTQFVKAYESFQKGQENLDLTDKSLNELANLLPFKKDAEKMLKAAQLVSQSGLQMAQMLNLLSQAKISAQGMDFGEKASRIYSGC
jgi:hypothetical protein